MKFRISSIAGLLLILVLVQPTVVSSENTGGEPDKWWSAPYPEPFDFSTVETDLTFIHVEGNQFVNGHGDTVVFMGVNISDPDKLARNGRWSKQHLAAVKEWGANLVRVPVHPVAWRTRGKDAYFELLDQAVMWASELDMHLIIEWHSIGNLKTELFQHPQYDTTKTETFAFWRAVAHRYAGIPTIAFYELFNEPTTFNGTLGRVTWQEWKEINEEIIHIIYAHDTNVIPLVGGFDWAYELRHVREDPIDATGIGYVSHPYPMKTSEPFEVNWEKDFGYVADTYPLIATELGFMAAEDPGAHIPVISDEEYGRRITSYFAKKGISWTAWCFDPDWPPQLISDWEYTPTVQGAFFKGVMKANTSR